MGADVGADGGYISRILSWDHKQAVSIYSGRRRASVHACIVNEGHASIHKIMSTGSTQCAFIDRSTGSVCVCVCARDIVINHMEVTAV